MREEVRQFCYERLCNRTAMHLENAMRALPPFKQRVIKLHCTGLDFEEIGEALGIAPTSARVYFNSGVRSLRKAYVAAEYSDQRGWTDFERAALRRAYYNSVFHK